MTETRMLKRIGAVSTPKLNAQLKGLQASGEDEVIVDMEEAIYISPVGLRAFAPAQKKMDKSRGPMTLRDI